MKISVHVLGVGKVYIARQICQVNLPQFNTQGISRNLSIKNAYSDPGGGAKLPNGTVRVKFPTDTAPLFMTCKSEIGLIYWF